MTRTTVAGALLGAGFLTALLLAPGARAQDVESEGALAEREAILSAISDLADGEKAELALVKLVAVGEPAVNHLLGEALEGKDVASRGWAIVALSEIGGEAARRGLTQLHENSSQPKLVRTWAVAGIVRMAKDAQELTQLSTLVQRYPAIARPIALRLIETSGDDRDRVSTMLLLASRHPQLGKALTKAILALGSGPLIKVLLSDTNQAVRRQAAAYLGALAARGEKVGALVAEVYAFDPKAKEPPWEGGPIFLPQLQPWPEEDAKTLTKNLVAWFFWSDRHGRADLKQQIINNLQSIGLGRVTQFWPAGRDDPQAWARSYGQSFGKAELSRLLKTQDLLVDPAFKRILDSLN